MAFVTTTQPPTEEIRILCTTDQLAKVATKAAAAGLSLEDFVNQELHAKLHNNEEAA